MRTVIYLHDNGTEVYRENNNTLPAGWYESSIEGRHDGNVRLDYINSDKNDESLPPFTYWFSEEDLNLLENVTIECKS